MEITITDIWMPWILGFLTLYFLLDIYRIFQKLKHKKMDAKIAQLKLESERVRQHELEKFRQMLRNQKEGK